MNLPEHLKKKRDEVGELFDRSSWYGRRSMDYFDAGFDAACAELLPMIEKLEKALEKYVDGSAYDFDRQIRGEVNFNMALSMATARQAISEIKKWRES